MLRKLLDVFPAVAAPVFERASDVLGREVLSLDGDVPAAIISNADVQLSMFVANHVHAEILRGESIEADFSIGLSLGEYNHLVHIGALDFESALRLVAARGAAYDRGPAGAMAAVFPVDEEAVVDAISRARSAGTLEIANYNSPTQHVIAGDRQSLDAAVAILEEEQAASCIVIDERLPMHCSLFSPVAEMFAPALDAAPFRVPVRPYLPNVLGAFADDASPAHLRTLLARQVSSPVRFRQAIDMLFDFAPGSVYVEVGPRSVIYNLLSRKWHAFRRYKTDAEAGVFAETIAGTARELRRAA
jgi:[acyl-carrier-protein] S-malonyltransferase